MKAMFTRVASLLPTPTDWRFLTALSCFAGYLTFWTTGANKNVETTIFIVVLLMTAVRPTLLLPKGIAQAGCIGFAIACILEHSAGTASIVALAHFATGIMILQLLSMNNPRSASLALLLSSMLVLTAGAMNVNFVFPLAFFPYVMFFCFSLQAIARAQQQSSATATFGQPSLMSQSGFVYGLLFSVLCVGFFYLVPRGDALSIGPSVVHQRIKGFSQTLRLGEVGSILENNMVVMRIKPIADFPITRPVIRHLRGLLLRGRSFSQFNQGMWTREGYRTLPVYLWNQRGLIQIDKKLRYGNVQLVLDILQENTDPPVLFVPVNAKSVSTNRLMVYADTDGSLSFERRNAGVETYHAHVEIGVPDLSEFDYPPWELVPFSLLDFFDCEDISPLVEDLARELSSGTRSVPERIERTMGYLRENCVYSLEEPESQIRDPIAKFLFVTRAGTCEHFASAMTLLLRAMGIPARPVSGYMMSEWNEYGGFFTVRQSDAHAWVKVYWPELGWVPFDPTPPQDDTLVQTLFGRFSGIRDIWNQFEAYWFNLVYRFDRRAQEAGFRKIWFNVQNNSSLIAAALFLLLALIIFRKQVRKQISGKTLSAQRKWIPDWFDQWEKGRRQPRRSYETPCDYLYRLCSSATGIECRKEDIDLVILEIRQALIGGHTDVPCSDACRESLHRLALTLDKKTEESV